LDSLRQKIAVFNLVADIISILLMVVAVVTLHVHFHLSWYRARRGLLFIVVAAIAGIVAPLIFKKDAGAVARDERDKLIYRTAILIGLVGLFIWFCLTGTVFAFLLEPEIFKSLGWPILMFGGGFIVVISQCITILVLYSRGGKGEKS
jgi:membrane protease YdiL (CAAX protease family)